MSKLVSIIVPVYNVKKYLEECLDSILNQTYENIELIIVDDGSTDGSREICKSFEQKDKRVVFVSKENGGVASARNLGIDIAKGDLIGFVDSDDSIMPDMIEKLVSVIIEKDADVAVCGFVRYEDETGNIYSREMISGKWDELTENDLGEILYVNPGPWNKLYRAELLKDIRFPQIRVAEDLVFMIDIIGKLKKIVRVKEELYRYRVRKNSAMNTIQEDDFNETLSSLIQTRAKIKASSANQEIYMLIDAIMFLHVGVSLTFRLVQGEKIRTKAAIKITKKILDREFSFWRKSKYLSLVFGIRKGIKGIGIWGCRLLYKINLFIIFINFYLFIQSKLHKDIKW